MAHRRQRLGIAFLIGIFCSTFLNFFTPLGLSPAKAVPPGFENHPIQPCMQALSQQGIFASQDVNRRYPNGALTQAEFAIAVLKAFPGVFAANNEYLGLTFDEASSEAEALLMAVRGEKSTLQRYVGRAEALAILTSGAATSYQADASRILSFAFRDSLLIPDHAKEGVAAALVAGHIVDAEGVTPNERHQLRPQRSTTLADGAAFICSASLDETIKATIPEDQIVAFVPLSTITAPTTELRGVWLTNIDSDVLFSRRKLDQAIERLAALNFNTIYPTVWNWGYTLFPSRVAERVTGYRQGLYPDLGSTGRHATRSH